MGFACLMRSGCSWECWVGVRREGELGQSVKASWRKGHPGMQPLGPGMSTHSWESPGELA